jgi:hypothetical protein
MRTHIDGASKKEMTPTGADTAGPTNAGLDFHLSLRTSPDSKD